MKNKSSTVTSRVEILFVLTTIFIALCLFVPVWQSAVSSRLAKQITGEERTYAALVNQKVTLQASIEKQKSPEYVRKTASARNISFVQISGQEASVVASSR